MQPQSSSWQGPLSKDEVTHQLRTALLGTRHLPSAYTREALIAEVLRVAVWALSVWKRDALRTGTLASTRRVLAHARAIWEPFHEENNAHIAQQHRQESRSDFEETDLERDTLDTLEEQGDILSLPGGSWLPAPLRLVPLGNTQYLLVGGLPTHLLPPAILQSLNFHGSFRHIYISTKEQPPTSVYIGNWQFQALSSWLGPTPPTLSELLQVFSSQTLLPVSDYNSRSMSYEAYAAYINKPQGLRWLSLGDVRDGRYLLRTRAWWGTKQYSIGEIQNRQLVRQSHELHRPNIEVRRLCYALDWKMKTPTQAKLSRTMLTLWSELPVRERRLMAAIATLAPEERYYPRIWQGITHKQLDNVSEMLQHLGITIISQDTKHR